MFNLFHDLVWGTHQKNKDANACKSPSFREGATPLLPFTLNGSVFRFVISSVSVKWTLSYYSFNEWKLILSYFLSSVCVCIVFHSGFEGWELIC